MLLSFSFDSSSLNSRFEKLMKTKRKNLKEAAKVHEYIRAVERGMQSAEIVQSVSAKNQNRRSKYLRHAGLEEIKRFVVSANDVQCLVSVLIPIDNHTKENISLHYPSDVNNNTTSIKSETQRTLNVKEQAALAAEIRKLRSTPKRFLPAELVIAITDLDNTGTGGDINGANSIARLFELIVNEKQIALPLVTKNYNGKVDLISSNLAEDVNTEQSVRDNTMTTSLDREDKYLYVQPTLFTLASKVLKEISELILLQPSSTSASDSGRYVETAQDITATSSSTDTIKKEQCDSASITTNNRVRSNTGDIVNVRTNYKKDSIYILPGHSLAASSSSSHSNNVTTTEYMNSDKALTSSKYNQQAYQHIRVVGHSIGGAVASLVAMLLDGGLLLQQQQQQQSNSRSSVDSSTVHSINNNIHHEKQQLGTENTQESSSINDSKVTSYAKERGDVDERANVSHNSDSSCTTTTTDSDNIEDSDSDRVNNISTSLQYDDSSNDSNKSNKCDYKVTKKSLKRKKRRNISYIKGVAALSDISSLIGAYSNHVHCSALGPPPCVSRTQIPRYITSYICGDDVVPRAQVSALRGLMTRVSKALQRGAGSGTASFSGISYMLGTGLFSDISNIAG